MADSNQTVTNFGSAGANTLLRFLASIAIEAGRKRGRPLQSLLNVSDTVSSVGNQVGVPILPVLSSRLLTDGNAITKDDSSGSTVNITLDRHRYEAFGATDVAAALNGSTQMQAQLRARLTAVMNGIDTDVLSCITTGITTNVIGTYNTDLTEAVIASGLGAFWGQVDAPPADQPLIGLIRPEAHAWTALSQIANFAQARGQSNPFVTADPNLMNGDYFWNGVNWRVCNSLPKNGTSIDNVILHPNAIGFAMRPLPLPMVGGVNAINVVDPDNGVAIQILQQRDGSRLADEFVVHSLYGYAVTKENYAILVKS